MRPRGPRRVLLQPRTRLDHLGLDMPTTTDEFVEVLRAFKDNDANGNGNPNDEIPLAFKFTDWGAYDHGF